MPADKRSKPSISLEELGMRAEAGTIGKSAREKFFTIDESRSRALSPAIVLNRDAVDLGGRKPSLPDTTALLNKATTADARESAKTVSATSAAPKTKVRIYSEGDSWFNLPDFPVPFRPRYPHDCIDILDRTFEAKPNTTAIWGDTLKNMTKAPPGGKQYLQKLGGGNFRHFLISGGGNDILENIADNLLPRKASDTNTGTVAKYVKPAYDQKIEKMIAYYKTIYTDVTGKFGSKIVMYVHGYGNCFPLPGGKYIGGPLKGLGFDPVTLPAMGHAIVTELVRRFNVALSTFASSHAGVVYIDMRPSLPDPADWNWDEIHPSEQGAVKVAANFKTAINQHSFLS